MGDKSHIEWTEATWNPVTGCTKVSQGCKHCYAERDWHRLQHLPRFNRPFTQVECHEDRLDQPLRWRKPRMIFVNSMSDLFHEDVPFEFIDKVFGVMAASPRHIFQILTKRPDRMREYTHRIADDCAPIWQFADKITGRQVDFSTPLPNVWLGVSVEDQATADQRIPILLDVPAAVRFLSCEPLLGQIDLTDIDAGGVGPDIIPRDYWTDVDNDDSSPALAIDCLAGIMWQRFGDWEESCEEIDWVVVGGESGPKARPLHPDFARSLRDQCASARVPYFFKQWGEWFPEYRPDGIKVTAMCQLHRDQRDIEGVTMYRVGKKNAGRELDGREWNEFPGATE